jgi:hypothetical protein
MQGMSNDENDLEYKKKVVSSKHFHQYPYSIFLEINQNVELMNFAPIC